MKKLLSTAFLLVGVVFSFPQSLFAAPLYAQTINSSSVFDDYYYFQQLGDGLSGNFDSVRLILDVPSGTQIGLALYDCASSAYSGGCGSSPIFLTAPVSGVQEFDFSIGSTTLNPTRYYALEIQNQNSAVDITLLTSPTQAWSGGELCNSSFAGGCATSYDKSSYFVLYSGLLPPSYFPALFWDSTGLGADIFLGSTTVNIDAAFNSGGLATTSIASFCDVNLPFDNSSIIQATLTYVPNGLCRVASFLVIPTPASLNQLSTLASTTKDRFPFSFVLSVTDTWEGLTASTTANSPEYEYNLHDLGIGSTTPMGNFLPNVTVFASSTVMQYFPAGMFEALRTLAALCLILILITDIFFSTKHMLKK